MLVLRRREGQWLEIKCVKTGDTMRVRVYNIGNNQADLAFDDSDKNFTMNRPERVLPIKESA